MAELDRSHAVTISWHSFELRPKGGPPVSPEYKAQIEAGRPRLYATAKEHYGLDLNPGPWGINSRPALIGGKFAEAQGVGDAYHDAVFRAYWQQGVNIEDAQALSKIAVDVGLDREGFGEALASADYDALVQSDIDQAQQFGLSSVPSMVFDDKYLVVGAQPYAALTQAIEQIQAAESEAG